MHNFYKTELGFRTLKLRDLPLNARQRRLLLLIGTEDFNTLNHTFQQRIAAPELLLQLIDLGLICQQNSVIEIQISASELKTNAHDEILAQPSEIQTTRHLLSLEALKTTVSPIDPSTHMQTPHADSPITTQLAEALNFDDVKQLMIQPLQQYCGLMGKLLIEKIKRSEQLAQLKACQMQWITLLQESRISPKNLNDALQHINLSMHILQSS